MLLNFYTKVGTKMPANKDNLIWIDLEMTGLDTEEDVIIEIATIVTDSCLAFIAEGPVIAIHQSDATLEAMDEWNTKQHSKSGLTERVKQSTQSVLSAQTATLEFLQEHVPAGKSPMCGNSICQDRRFLAKHMPELEAYFHYRHIDVSTIKELANRWRPDFKGSFTKKNTHLALDDIRESIAELAFYREKWLQGPNTTESVDG